MSETQSLFGPRPWDSVTSTDTNVPVPFNPTPILPTPSWPPYEPAPGNVHDFIYQQVKLVKRNFLFEEMIPFVSNYLATSGYIAGLTRLQEPKSTEGWVYPVMFLLTLSDTGSNPYTVDLAVVLYHYDVARGNPETIAKQLIERHKWYKSFES